jgi:hypothetical protein
VTPVATSENSRTRLRSTGSRVIVTHTSAILKIVPVDVDRLRTVPGGAGGSKFP